MIRIAIADDHPMIIGGLQNLLTAYPHILLTATYPDGRALLEGLQQEQPDVLLLDIQMPGRGGDELAPLLVKQYPDMRILVLSNFNSTLYIHSMLRHGAHGYVLKTTGPETLMEAVEAVYDGLRYIDPSMRDKLQQFTDRMKKEASLKPRLSLREKEILKMTVNGDTIQEIAGKLFIGLRTVEYYRSNLFVKLDVKNMAALIKKALELGLAE